MKKEDKIDDKIVDSQNLELNKVHHISMGVIVFLGVLVIVLLAVSWIFWFKREHVDSKVPTKFKVETSKLPDTQTLSGFPEDLPMEDADRIVKNLESKTNDGRLQSTKKFITKLAPEQALYKYAIFFMQPKQNWIRSERGEIKSPALFKKDNDILMLVTSKDSKTSETVVEITIIQSSPNK